jgi:hypothetical protein
MTRIRVLTALTLALTLVLLVVVVAFVGWERMGDDHATWKMGVNSERSAAG